MTHINQKKKKKYSAINIIEKVKDELRKEKKKKKNREIVRCETER